MAHHVAVVIPTPAHSTVADALTYASEQALVPGTLVRVPLGNREVLGIVWTPPMPATGSVAIKPVSVALQGIAPLSTNWRQLVQFAASYYQRGLGEIGLAALP